MKLYKIREWSTRYENSQSRRCAQLHWVPVPARHDAERYCELMARPDASEIFTAWIICLQVGARSEPRGSLMRSDGSPHTPESLAIKTRGHLKWFEKALPYLTQIAWLECVTTDYESTPSQVGVNSEAIMQEGREGMEENEGKVAIAPKASLNVKKNLPDEEWLSEVRKLYPDLDFDSETRKMDAWLLANHGRKKTRQFMVNWLNRANPVKINNVSNYKPRPNGDAFK